MKRKVPLRFLYHLFVIGFFVLVMGALPTIHPAQALTATPSGFPPSTTLAPSGPLKLQYRAADTVAGDNQMKPHFNIVNGTTASVPLSELKIRYYFTKEAGGTMVFNCDYAVVACSNLVGTFGTISPAVTGADTYLEVGFSTAAGSIAAGGNSGEIQTRLNKSDFTNFNESDDYSFDPTKTAFADWTKVALYRNGTLVWGSPAGVGTVPTNTPTSPTATSVTPTGLPDLVISNMRIINTLPCAIQYSVEVTVSNLGGTTPTAFSVNLSSPFTSQPQQAISGLAAGQSTIVTYPISQTNGTSYTLSGSVDNTSQVAESNETNNSYSQTATIPTVIPPCTPGGPTPTASFTPFPSLTPTFTYTPGGPTITPMPPTSTTIPFAQFSASPVEGLAPLTVTFSDGYPDGLYRCSWTFGDGGTSSSCATQNHTYVQVGVYSVSFSVVRTASGNGGGITKYDLIRVVGPGTPTRTPTNTNTPTNTPLPMPDLSIGGIGQAVSPTVCDARPGISVGVFNGGNASAGIFALTVNGQSQTINGLAAGAQTSVWFPINGGTLNITVDSANQVAESNEGNNSVTQPIASATPPATCTPSPTPPTQTSNLPDLVITSISYVGSSPSCINQPRDAVVVTNQGTFAAGSFVVSFGFSGQTVSGLQGGQSLTLYFSALQGGQTATADSLNQVTESNESNNSLTSTGLPVPTQAPTCQPTTTATANGTTTDDVFVEGYTSFGTCRPTLSNVSIYATVNGAMRLAAVTNSAGYFSVDLGTLTGDVTITPQRSGYAFSPASSTWTHTANTLDHKIIYFTVVSSPASPTLTPGGPTPTASLTPTSTACPSTATPEPTPTKQTVTLTPSIIPTKTLVPCASPCTDVIIANMAFTPANLTIGNNTRVRWINNDAMTHTVTANDGSFNATLAPGDSFVFTFTTASFDLRVDYHCNIHTSMTGIIIVTHDVTPTITSTVPTLTPVPDITPTAIPRPDLIVASVGYTTPPNCSTLPNIDAVIKNVGTGNAGSFVVSLNTGAQTYPISGIPAGGQATAHFSFVSGSVLVEADPGQAVAESNENNNGLLTGLTPPATCTPSPVTVTPTKTNTPTGGLIVQIKNNGAETNQQTPFAYVVKNTGSSAISNISVRVYFTLDGSNAASGYVLEKYYDQSGVATVAAPTLFGNGVYYFTVGYGTASLAPGAQWEFQTSLHLGNWGTTYNGANDWYHIGYAANALPAAYTTTNYLPVYVNGTLTWGVIP